MSVTITQLALYAGALFILFITPGPVWVAVIARAVSGGFRSAVPLALGVAVGDILWPLVALLGVSYLVSFYADILILFRYAAALILCLMGAALVRWPDKVLSENSQFTRPGMWAGFAAGMAAVIANPKASLFYMTLLPSFFDFNQITKWDMVAICILSFIVPLLGNLCLAGFVNQMRRFLASPEAVRKTNIYAGIALILVGVIIALT
ncbi:lysine transporter LysE [Amylibacter marinus]|uniref:Lysine transporter LysE n=1 Tax=Amylibacter marinus TaxID=1475483 RepID=A0ABQ5VWK6_9RHOB|nr:LysE family translocator [Amylibacter marinus]GLQ35677.1 lysine transporter LysE [Amylibacter marinus]